MKSLSQHLIRPITLKPTTMASMMLELGMRPMIPHSWMNIRNKTMVSRLKVEGTAEVKLKIRDFNNLPDQLGSRNLVSRVAILLHSEIRRNSQRRRSWMQERK